MTADDLVAMLAAKHTPEKAVFVAECKMGPDGSRRLDAWALLKTWSPPTIIGYETKVSRSDFLNDHKWPEYLPVCHELYFVAPPKVIDVAELPQDVGLMVVAGSRLVTKRRAVRREPNAEKLVRLMSYVLMSRSRVVADMWESAKSGNRADEWRAWLPDKRENKQVGRGVSKALAEKLQEARHARVLAETEYRRLKHVDEKLEALGIRPGSDGWSVKEWARQNSGPRVDLEQLRQQAQRLLALIPRDPTP